MGLVWKCKSGEVYQGHVLDEIRQWEAKSVQCCVTSPPYWGLRDYKLPPQIWDDPGNCQHKWEEYIQPAANGIIHNGGMSGKTLSGTSATRKPKKSDFCQLCGAWRGSLGLEPTPELYVKHMVEIFRDVRRVLRDDGTLWLNLGSSYSSGNRTHRRDPDSKNIPALQNFNRIPNPNGFKSKDLIPIPWMVAMALQQDGWYLRQDIIWNKPNPMPESVTDRCTKAHEYIFLLSKSAKYYYDADAIREESIYPNDNRINRANEKQKRMPSEKIAGIRPRVVKKPSGWDTELGSHGTIHRNGRTKTAEYQEGCYPKRNKRSVWTIPTKPFSGAHFAVFPPELIKPCILAGSPPGGIVFDPFGGSGTTAITAYKNGRQFKIIELSEEYLTKIAIPRIKEAIDDLFE